MRHLQSILNPDGSITLINTAPKVVNQAIQESDVFVENSNKEELPLEDEIDLRFKDIEIGQKYYSILDEVYMTKLSSSTSEKEDGDIVSTRYNLKVKI